MTKIAIVGFGRFGNTLYQLLNDDFDISVYSRSKVNIATEDNPEGINFLNEVKQIYESDVVIYSVPIEKFESVIADHSKYFTNQTLIDVLSVKKHPEAVFQKYCKDKQVEILLTHPMFGPDSSKNGFDNLPIVLANHSLSKNNYEFWKKYFKNKNLKVIEMTADKHDKLAAKSQSIAHYIGRSLKDFDINRTEIDTVGAGMLNNIVDVTTNDTIELFKSMQNYNPYANKSRQKLNQSLHKIHNSVYPDFANTGKLTIGIQGGQGSFNEQAIHEYIAKNKIKNHDIRYLYTSEKVLNSLNLGEIDLGIFAIHNSVGGIVQESIDASAKYQYKIVEQISIVISHHLMKLPTTELENIDTIMAHPQVLKQCKQSLIDKYPNLNLESGAGVLIDTAEAAKALSRGEISNNIAILGNLTIKNIYDLEVIENNLEDSTNNITYFLLVSRD